jgi:hypothetical protein
MSKVHCTYVANVYEHKQWIIATIAPVAPEMSRHVWVEVSYGLDICCATKGENMEIS